MTVWTKRKAAVEAQQTDNGMEREREIYTTERIETWTAYNEPDKMNVGLYEIQK